MDCCFVLAYGARCGCPDKFQGDFCQYSTVVNENKNNPPVEYRQFDAETLAAITGLGLSNPSHQRAITFAIALGNRSQFVFCLTNPCENGGTCFVTNSATTKVNKTCTNRKIINGICALREFVFAVKDLLVIIVRICIIKLYMVLENMRVIVRRIHV
jgi:hypothetical protein